MPHLSLALILPFVAQATAVGLRPQGFVGTYHAASGNVHDGQNTSAYNSGKWGIAAVENGVHDGSWSFKEAVQFYCNNASVNQLYGMIIGHSEGGVWSNTNDTDLWHPLGRGGAAPGTGILQGAARWSKLSQICPQIAGIIVDDFFNNYAPPSPPDPGPCAHCPVDRPHLYGTGNGGFFCCAYAARGHCEPPPGKPEVPPCCIAPGFARGCQSVSRCGTNPANHTPCGAAVPLDEEHMAELKAALSGKELLPDGRVNLSSVATTPHLQLQVVTYEPQIDEFAPGKSPARMLSLGLIDGISFWIEGRNQDTNHSDLTNMVRRLRGHVGRSLPIYTGAYLTNSATGLLTPAPAYDMLQQSMELYNSGQVSGFYWFSGTALGALNETDWLRWDLPGWLAANYWPWVSDAKCVVLDAATGKPIRDALAVVWYNGTTLVTRKRSDTTGEFAFGGWVGKTVPAKYMVEVSAAGYKSSTFTESLKVNATALMQFTLEPDDELGLLSVSLVE